MALTYQDRVKFEKIMNNTLETLKELRDNKLIFPIDLSNLSEMVSTAKRKNKLNNYLLNEKSTDAVYRLECLNIETNKLIWLNVRPNKLNNVKKMFIY